jgi:hypothetical protein
MAPEVSLVLWVAHYESGAYTSNPQDKCQRLEWELSKEKKKGPYETKESNSFSHITA